MSELASPDEGSLPKGYRVPKVMSQYTEEEENQVRRATPLKVLFEPLYLRPSSKILPPIVHCGYILPESKYDILEAYSTARGLDVRPKRRVRPKGPSEPEYGPFLDKSSIGPVFSPIRTFMDVIEDFTRRKLRRITPTVELVIDSLANPAKPEQWAISVSICSNYSIGPNRVPPDQQEVEKIHVWFNRFLLNEKNENEFQFPMWRIQGTRCLWKREGEPPRVRNCIAR